MLLSIVVNLSSTVNGTQAASPLVYHGGTSSIDSATAQFILLLMLLTVLALYADPGLCDVRLVVRLSRRLAAAGLLLSAGACSRSING